MPAHIKHGHRFRDIIMIIRGDAINPPPPGSEIFLNYPAYYVTVCVGIHIHVHTFSLLEETGKFVRQHRKLRTLRSFLNILESEQRR